MTTMVLVHPYTLRHAGFQACEHPLYEVTPFSGEPYRRVRYCLTCGATLCTSPDWKAGVLGIDTPIKYERLELHRLLPAFEFWARQRPASRVFGDVS